MTCSFVGFVYTWLKQSGCNKLPCTASECNMTLSCPRDSLLSAWPSLVYLTLSCRRRIWLHWPTYSCTVSAGNWWPAHWEHSDTGEQVDIVTPYSWLFRCTQANNCWIKVFTGRKWLALFRSWYWVPEQYVRSLVIITAAHCLIPRQCAAV